jgi:hypothetical protein
MHVTPVTLKQDRKGIKIPAGEDTAIIKKWDFHRSAAARYPVSLLFIAFLGISRGIVS